MSNTGALLLSARRWRDFFQDRELNKKSDEFLKGMVEGYEMGSNKFTRTCSLIRGLMFGESWHKDYYDKAKTRLKYLPDKNSNNTSVTGNNYNPLEKTSKHFKRFS